MSLGYSFCCVLCTACGRHDLGDPTKPCAAAPPFAVGTGRTNADTLDEAPAAPEHPPSATRAAAKAASSWSDGFTPAIAVGSFLRTWVAPHPPSFSSASGVTGAFLPRWEAPHATAHGHSRGVQAEAGYGTALLVISGMLDTQLSSSDRAGDVSAEPSKLAGRGLQGVQQRAHLSS